MDDAFISAIQANPTDDAARLVYADWLDEQGESVRAEYLRLASALPRTDQNDPQHRELLARLVVLGDLVDGDWEMAVCRPSAVILESYSLVERRRLATVQAIRQATGLWLHQAILLVGGNASSGSIVARRGLPKVIVQGIDLSEAERIAVLLRGASDGSVRVYSG